MKRVLQSRRRCKQASKQPPSLQIIFFHPPEPRNTLHVNLRRVEAEPARSCSSARDHGFRRLGDLLSGPVDPLALVVLDVVDRLVLPLRPLPDLHFASTPDHTDAHRAEQVVGRVGMEVDSAIEHLCRILADSALDHSAIMSAPYRHSGE